MFLFHTAEFLRVLPLLLKGWMGVFAVILVIWAFIALLSRVTGVRGKK